MHPPQNEQIALWWNTCVEQTFHGRETRFHHSGFIIHHHSSSFIIIHHVMSAKRDQSYDQWYNLQETLFDYDFIKRTHSGINFSRLIHLLPAMSTNFRRLSANTNFVFLHERPWLVFLHSYFVQKDESWLPECNGYMCTRTFVHICTYTSTHACIHVNI